MKKICIVGLLAVAWAFCPAQDLIQGMYSYTYGDSESKVDARETCKNLALRDALESYSVYVESSTQVENYQLTKDQIRTLSSGILRNIEIVEEKEEGRTLTMVVSAAVNPGEIQSFLNQQIQKEPAASEEPVKTESLPDFQEALKNHEDRVTAAQKDMDRKDYLKAILVFQESERLIEKFGRSNLTPFNQALYRAVKDRSVLIKEMAKLHYIRSKKNRQLEQGQVRAVVQRSARLAVSQEKLQKAPASARSDEILRKNWVGKCQAALKLAKVQVGRAGKRK
jgi:hypothetical protein